MKVFSSLGFILMFVSSAVQSQDIINYNHPVDYSDKKQSYYLGILKLALDASQDRFGPYQLKAHQVVMLQERTARMVGKGELLDVTWRMTNREMERQLKPIYVPLLKGLMGMRLFVIKKDHQALFNKDLSLQAIQRMTAGQGHDWPDTEILRANNFKLQEGHDKNLLKMLNYGRIDYFPRALHEPWTEISELPHLVVEQNILLRYPAPMYFFVNKKNKRLHQRLSYGLKQLLVSGKFDQYFYQHPLIIEALAKAKLANRKVIAINNPLLSSQSKELLKDKKMWIDLEKLASN